jgi:hypothetical protein
MLFLFCLHEYVVIWKQNNAQYFLFNSIAIYPTFYTLPRE